MSNHEIIAKAIEKAYENGWKKDEINGWKVWQPVETLEPLVILEYGEDHTQQFNYQTIIFNHDFAKALWGDSMEPEFVITDVSNNRKWPAYKWHLQQMVIADDPIAYLDANLPTEGE